MSGGMRHAWEGKFFVGLKRVILRSEEMRQMVRRDLVDLVIKSLLIYAA